MPLRNVLLSNITEIENSYLDNVTEEDVSEWHLANFLVQNAPEYSTFDCLRGA